MTITDFCFNTFCSSIFFFVRYFGFWWFFDIIGCVWWYVITSGIWFVLVDFFELDRSFLFMILTLFVISRKISGSQFSWIFYLVLCSIFHVQLLLSKLFLLAKLGCKKYYLSAFKRQPHKIVKQTQPIRRLLPTNCLSVFDHFVGLALKGLKDFGYLDALISVGLRYAYLNKF